eukprot:TCALIF_06634-PA protein Name:"Similar to HMCN2 Hemicentin-2 (Homo sapiens)" AED:0.02 eAED:0.03 QI:0/0.5/0.28/0.85/1/1/7/253/1111
MTTNAANNAYSEHRHPVIQQLQRSPPLNITAVTGISVDLRCKVKLHECGNFYSIEWYRHLPGNVNERVYVYRHHSGNAKSEGSWENRARHVYNAKRHAMRVSLYPTQLQDEAFYSCEITYEVDGPWFNDTCLTPQVTRLKVLGKPKFLAIALENGTNVDEHTVIGPYNEGSLLVLRCSAGGGRPIPEVTWWNGTQEISNSWHWRVEHENGTGNAKSEINVMLNRFNQGRRLVCSANSSALDQAMRTSVVVDMNLAPETLTMVPPTGPIVEGGRVTVTCIARGAKPAAYIYWNSEPELDLNDMHEEISQTGQTFETLNRLSFPAERKLTSLSCFASNSVLDDKKGLHLKQDTTINVKFAPEIESRSSVNLLESVHGEEISLVCRYHANPMLGTKVTWFLNGEPIDYELRGFAHESEDNSVLKITEVDKSAQGSYSCSARNEIGHSKRVEQATVLVEEKPQVVLTVEPDHPVSELLNANVTLKCQSERGEQFLAVKWYLDGELLKHVERPLECFVNETNEVIETADNTKCQMDPSKIILVNVRRTFHGNYSCRGRNRAGWGGMSSARQLQVMYPPTGARMTQKPSIVIKGRPFQLSCVPVDPGFPSADRVKWYHNGQEIKGQEGFLIGIKEAKAHSAGNYTCKPFNQVGIAAEVDIKEASANIEVHIAPKFLRNLKPITGAPIDKRYLRLVCEVECDPHCSIVWFHNNKPIPDNATHFQVRFHTHAPNPSTNTLLKVESILETDFRKWPPDGILRPARDNGNFSCRSSPNEVGAGVASHTQFRVHFPPRNITLTPRNQIISEGTHPSTLQCQSDAFPPAKFFWTFRGDSGDVRTRAGPILDFRHPITRDQAGYYTCVAVNDMGKLNDTVKIDVIYRPTCRLRKDITDNGQLITLKCMVQSYPSNVTYYWYYEDVPIPHANADHYTVPNGALGSYACSAQNMAGMCERIGIKVGDPAALLVAESDYTIVAFGVGVVVVLFIVILVGILVCRHHSVGKYPLQRSRTNGEVNHQIVPNDSKGGVEPPGNGVSMFTTTKTHLVPNHVTFATVNSPSSSGSRRGSRLSNGHSVNGNSNIGTLTKTRKLIDPKSPTIEVQFDEIQSESAAGLLNGLSRT